MQTFWTGDCSGGIRWKEDLTYRASISNSLSVQVNAALADRTGDATYRTRAQQGRDWFRSKGFIGSDGLVVDGVDGTSCAAVGQRYTYNQGVFVPGLIALSKVTGDRNLISTARSVADSATRTGSFFTGTDGIVQDPGEGSSTDDWACLKAGSSAVCPNWTPRGPTCLAGIPCQASRSRLRPLPQRLSTSTRARGPPARARVRVARPRRSR